MNSLKTVIKTLSAKYADEFIDIRNHLHKYPELSFKEYKTAEFIAKKLNEYGVSFTSGIAETGVLAIIEGKNPSSKVIAIRADMDALPIEETNEVPYKSCNAGIMHACGHDVHIACLLGATKILNELKNDFEGTIKLIFQPSEESFPGGAIKMIEAGVLENPKVEMVIGQHVLPQLEAGKMGLKPGMYMASTDEVYLTVKGKGGHAATPELNVDPIIISAQILVALQQVVSRFGNPAIPSVLSFGKIIGNGRTNIIPDEVKIDGTLRTFNEQWRKEAHEHIISIAKSIAKGMNGDCDVFIDKGYPFLVNDENLTKQFKNEAIEFLGASNVVDLDLRMTAEDFAYFTQKVPSCFYRLGVGNPNKGIISNLHTSTFNIDESSIETGVGLMAWLAIESLKK
ncbi:MAG: M20 family metallopeptidase [Bacteroidota bacterium]